MVKNSLIQHKRTSSLYGVDTSFGVLIAFVFRVSKEDGHATEGASNERAGRQRGQSYVAAGPGLAACDRACGMRVFWCAIQIWRAGGIQMVQTGPKVDFWAKAAIQQRPDAPVCELHLLRFGRASFAWMIIFG